MRKAPSKHRARRLLDAAAHHRRLAVPALLLSGGLAAAADADGNFVIKGAGRITCAEFVSAQSERSAAFTSIAGWLEGYLTAHNETGPATFDLAAWQDTDLLLAALGNWCRDRPADTLHTAAFRLAQNLEGSKLTERSERVNIAARPQAIHLHAEVIRRMQASLKRRGFLESEPTGRFDDATRSALRDFQSHKQLPPTGTPDQVTLANLL